MSDLAKIIAVAKGECLADLVLRNGTVANVLTGKFVKGDVAVADGIVVGIGDYRGKEEVDCAGQYVLPGLIDTHLHIESSMLCPREFAEAVLACGTTSFIADPHEIANVCGMKGVEYMIEELAPLPINAKVMLPSCVPATPFETSGAVLDARAIEENIGRDGVFGLGEFMNFVGVVHADPDPLAKLQAAHACGKPVDGHSMTLDGKSLNAYVAAGIRTDHESTDVESMTARIDRGMYIQLREGCATKNVEALLPGVTPKNLRRCVFCTDDKHVDDLLTVGHLNNNLRVAVRAGMDPIDAVTVATLNAAECYGLRGRGAVAPSYYADLVVVDDLRDFRARRVYFEGKLVAENGRCVFPKPTRKPCPIGNTVRFAPVTAESFRLKSESDFVRTMRLTPKNVVTTEGTARVERRDGTVLLPADLSKIAVVERHRGTGNIGLGLLEGYGLTGGAIAQTVAHDSHNLIVLGDSDADMALACNELAAMGGGLVVVRNGAVTGRLALPIGGLMTELPIEELRDAFTKIVREARELGVSPEAEPFMTLSFLCLPVIPSIRITDRGLFDVNAFRFLPIEAD